MTTIITVSNQKGGTGKTAMSFELGSILAKSNKVLFVDLDPQADLSRMLTDESPNTGFLGILKRNESAESAVLNINDNVSLIPSTDDLLRADVELIKQGGNISGRLLRALDPIKDNYDYIVIDTPPALSTIMVMALSAASLVYIPVLSENNSIDGLMNFLDAFVQVVRGEKNPATIGGIIVTRYNGRSTINRQMLENIQKIGDQIRTVVYPVKETVKLREAHFFKQSITEYAPKTDTSKQLIKIIDDIERNQS